MPLLCVVVTVLVSVCVLDLSVWVTWKVLCVVGEDVSVLSVVLRWVLRRLLCVSCMTLLVLTLVSVFCESLTVLRPLTMLFISTTDV